MEVLNQPPMETDAVSAGLVAMVASLKTLLSAAFE